MSKYVNVDDVLEHAQVNCEDAGFIMKLTDYLLDDAEELLMCKDCRFYKEYGGHQCGTWYSGYTRCMKFHQDVDYDDFCSKGERA